VTSAVAVVVTAFHDASNYSYRGCYLRAVKALSMPPGFHDFRSTKADPRFWANYGPVIVSQCSETAFRSHPCRGFSISYDRIGYCHGRGRGFESRRPRHSSNRRRICLSKVTGQITSRFLSTTALSEKLPTSRLIGSWLPNQGEGRITREPISSSPETIGLLRSVSFSTSYPELDF
jgi:hypothetical protein